jgi:hypothetical protein
MGKFILAERKKEKGKRDSICESELKKRNKRKRSVNRKLGYEDRKSTAPK